MTTPSGQIAISDVNIELGLAATRANSSLNDTSVRTLALVPSGQISMSNLQSKSNTFTLTIGDAQNGNLRSIANAYGYNNQPKVYLILSGTMYSYSTGAPACVVGSWPTGTALTIELRGTIQAYGGLGGAGAAANAGWGGSGGGAGGYALQFNSGIAGGSITMYINGGWVYGGGGGGGGGAAGGYASGGGGDRGPNCLISGGGNGGNGQGFAIAQSGGAAPGVVGAGGYGGWGGGWGAAGAGGGWGAYDGNACSSSVAGPGGGGGAAGYAYLGWGNVSSYIGNTSNYSGSVA